MTNIRRYNDFNRPIFVTVVCYKRKTCLKSDTAKELLLSVMREIKKEKPYTMLGYVILDDHFHWMIRFPRKNENELSGSPPTANTLTYNKGDVLNPRYVNNPHRSSCDRRELPDGKKQKDNNDNNTKHAISKIMQSLKLRYTHRYKKKHDIASNTSLWQRRFWDHIIKDQEDFNRHLEYIHYNPVKHRYIGRPMDYSFSSFPEYVERGVYKPDWGATEEPVYLTEAQWE